MANLELEFRFESVKRKVLKRIEMIKQEWEKVWAEASGNPEAETKLIPLKLKMQLMEMEVMDELKDIEKRIAQTG